VLHTVQTAVQPHLRDPVDFLANANMSNLAASQVTMEGSYIALSPLTLQMKQQLRDKALHKATVGTLPLYTLPTMALLQGACTINTLPCDVFRVYECNCMHMVQGGSAVSISPAVGVIVRRTFADNDTRTDGIVPGEEVFWLYNPVAAAAGNTWDAAIGRNDRECSLLLTTKNSTFSSDTTSTTITTTVQAEPCSVSRRSCPLKPNVSVRAFVQGPPPDTACIVQPSSATYRSDMLSMNPSMPHNVRDGGQVTGNDSDGGESGVLKGNLFFPTAFGTQSAPAPVNSPTSPQNTTIRDAIVGLYAALCTRLHYLIFPGTTYYIQYYQADVRESIDTTTSVNTGHTAAGIQTVTVDASTPATNTNDSASSKTQTGWELLIVTQPPLDYGTTNNMHIVNTIPLSMGSIYCDHLIALEDEDDEAETTFSSLYRREFPPCLVSLSAADSAGMRSVIVKTMTSADTIGSTRVMGKILLQKTFYSCIDVNTLFLTGR